MAWPITVVMFLIFLITGGHLLAARLAKGEVTEVQCIVVSIVSGPVEDKNRDSATKGEYECKYTVSVPKLTYDQQWPITAMDSRSTCLLPGYVLTPCYAWTIGDEVTNVNQEDGSEIVAVSVLTILGAICSPASCCGFIIAILLRWRYGDPEEESSAWRNRVVPDDDETADAQSDKDEDNEPEDDVVRVVPDDDETADTQSDKVERPELEEERAARPKGQLILFENGES
jgi:hypothetical protein